EFAWSPDEISRKKVRLPQSCTSPHTEVPVPARSINTPEAPTETVTSLPGSASRQRVPPRPRPPSSLSWKGIATGALLLWPNAYWQVQMEIIRGSAHPTTVSLFFNCIFILLVVTLANRAVAAFRPRWALARADLLVVYSMLAIGSCATGVNH